ncbi:MAG: hypothetical protein ACR2PZ_08260 [Pseudomonadales bacterium]
MSVLPDSMPRSSDFPACKAIICILPDDGSDKRLLAELRDRQGIIRAASVTCRGIGALAGVKTKRGKLPEPDLVKKVYVACLVDQAEEIFEFIFWSAQLDKPRRGVMWQLAITGGTPFELPADVPDEAMTGA